ncbi:MAG: F0F1 ATP synthase subunit A [Thermodesulfobacteriota bacterium]|nr:F0F1 ATP synthase subunit A [Thermodesulfobacteriota bacterium]
MEHPILFLNQIFAGIGLGDFADNYVHIIHSWWVALIMLFFAIIFTRGIKMLPTKGQNVLEIIVNGLENFMVEITGPEGRFFFPFIATVFLFILISNLVGLIPGFFSPTANINTTIALALCTVGYTHIIGIKFHGVKYVKHFLGPVWWLAPLMLPIELIGHVARVMSLSVRLFGNIFGKEMVLSILFALAGFYLVPLPIMVLGILVSFIQALVFMLLATMYFVGAMEEAH